MIHGSFWSRMYANFLLVAFISVLVASEGTTAICSGSTPDLHCTAEEIGPYDGITGTTTICSGSTPDLYCTAEEIGPYDEITESSSSAKRFLVQTLLEKRQKGSSVNKWGSHLPRIAVALFLSDSSFFSPHNETGREIAYELALQMLLKISQNKLSTEELAMFINAMIISCIDPNDFFGVDLVAVLRSRAYSDNYLNPFAFLTLCNAHASIPYDLSKISSAFDTRFRRTETQALAAMAMVCLKNQLRLSSEEEKLKDIRDDLIIRYDRNGDTGGLRANTIVLQAILSIYKNPGSHSRLIPSVIRQMKSEKLSLNDIHYILPLLNFKTLIDINSNHCLRHNLIKGINTSKFVSSESHRQTQVSVLIGHDADLVRKWKLKVPVNCAVYQVFERINSMELVDKIHFGLTKDNKPYIVGISKIFDDADKGMFWFPYTKNINASSLHIILESPKDVRLKENEELILWYRPASKGDFQ